MLAVNLCPPHVYTCMCNCACLCACSDIHWHIYVCTKCRERERERANNKTEILEIILEMEKIPGDRPFS